MGEASPELNTYQRILVDAIKLAAAVTLTVLVEPLISALISPWPNWVATIIGGVLFGFLVAGLTELVFIFTVISVDWYDPDTNATVEGDTIKIWMTPNSFPVDTTKNYGLKISHREHHRLARTLLKRAAANGLTLNLRVIQPELAMTVTRTAAGPETAVRTGSGLSGLVFPLALPPERGDWAWAEVDFAAGQLPSTRNFDIEATLHLPVGARKGRFAMKFLLVRSGVKVINVVRG